MQSGGDLLSGVVPGGDLFGQTSTDDMSGDVLGDKVSDLFDSAANGSSEGSRKGWLTASTRRSPTGSRATSTPVRARWATRSGDLYGDAHDASAAANPILSTARSSGVDA